MVKVKVIFGKIAVGGVIGNDKAIPPIEAVEAVVYRKGDVFDCPEDRLEAVESSNQTERLDKTQSLENTNVFGSADRNPTEKIEKPQPVKK